jgi:hypothetical protein
VAQLVRPEFRPTLREELARRGSGFRWTVLGILGALVVGLLVWTLRPTDMGVRYVHRPDPTFNLRYGHGFERLAPGPGEFLHIRRRGAKGRELDAFAVKRLSLPAYEGDVNGLLPVYAESVLAELRHAYPGLRLVEEGKARINFVAGYSILFRVGTGPDRMYGREVLLPKPEPGAREGVRMALRTWKGSGIAKPRDLGAVGALKNPYRSFRYGTEAP